MSTTTTPSSDFQDAEVEVTYGDVLTFMARQGVLRTITAPIDRVKYIMESQMEMVRRNTCAAAAPAGPHFNGSNSSLSSSTSTLPSHGAPAAAAAAGGGGPSRAVASRGVGLVSTHPSFLLNSKSTRLSGGTAAPFKTSFQALRHICRHEGVGFGLWRGNGVQLTSMAAQSLCHYHLSEPVMRATYTVLAPESEEGHLIASYAGFFCSGFFCAFVPYPLEFLRFHLAVDVKGLPRTSAASSWSGIGARPRTISSSNSSSNFFSSSHSPISSSSHGVLPPCSGGTPLDGSRYSSHTGHSGADGVPRSRERNLSSSHSAHSRHSPVTNTFSNNYRIPRGYAFLRHHPVLREWPQYCYTGLGLHVVGSAFYYLSHRIVSSAAESLWYYRRNRQHHYLMNDGNNEDAMLPPPPPSILARVIIDGFATLMATAIAHPVDLIRRRQMLAVLDDRTRYRHSWACVKHVAAEEGVRGFFRGMPISLARMVIIASLLQGIGIIEAELLMRRARGG